MGLLSLGGIFGFYAPKGLSREKAEDFLARGLSFLRHRGEGGWRLFFSSSQGWRSLEGEGVAPLSLPDGPFAWGLGAVFRGAQHPGWLTFPKGALVFAGRLPRLPREGDLAKESLSLEGALAFLAADGPFFYAARDRQGHKPLYAAREEEGFFFASEGGPGFPGWEKEGGPLPGGILFRFGPEGFMPLKNPWGAAKGDTRVCAFEALYHCRPDSLLVGTRVYALRHAMGRLLAREAPAPGDVVVGVPDSGTAAAHGYAEETRLPLVMGLWKNPYLGRTFLRSAPQERDWALSQKLFAIPEAVAGRRVVMVDDSIVRGATVAWNVKLLRQAGAREIHVRIASPPVVKGCPYGLLGVEEGALFQSHPEALPVESLAYLSLSAFDEALSQGEEMSFCRACFGKEAHRLVPL
ncbi:MAG: hypothetical protein QJR00_05470 [Bacillota bacterium]|nr:hypothetical protein [Bacillota bacterium]